MLTVPRHVIILMLTVPRRQCDHFDVNCTTSFDVNQRRRHHLMLISADISLTMHQYTLATTTSVSPSDLNP